VAGWGELLVDLQRKKEEGRRKEEEMANLAEICLNFEKIEI
jgi:hypothetical protein